MKRRNFLKYLINTPLILEILKNNLWAEILSSNLEAKLLIAYNEINSKFKLNNEEPALIVDGKNQRLYFVDGYNGIRIHREYEISTARKGFGNKLESNKTPIGIHRIKEKIGSDALSGTVFSSRINTGRIAKPNSGGFYSAQDCITSRIMWLEGCEKQNQTTYSRFIYIHGVPDEKLIKHPSSRGCILMKDKDIIELYDIISSGTYVNIKEHI